MKALFTQAEAADALNVSAAAVRSAVHRATLRTVSDDTGRVRITAQEIERFRHRNDPSFALSWSPSELLPPYTGTGFAPKIQTLLDHSAIVPTQYRGALVRVFNQLDSSPAEGIVVIGDLQRQTLAGSPGADAYQLAEALLPKIRRALGKPNVTVTSLCWLFLPGWLNAHGETDIVALTLGEHNSVHLPVRAECVSLSSVDRLLGIPLRTWPAVHPEDPYQVEQWDQAITGKLTNGVWVIDPAQGAQSISALHWLHSDSASDQERQLLVAACAELFVEPLIQELPIPVHYALPGSVAARLDVQVMSWIPSDADKHFVDSIPLRGKVNLSLDPARLVQIAERWLSEVDRYSKTPVPRVASSLEFFLHKLRENPEGGHGFSQLWYPTDILAITSDTAKQWVRTLAPTTASPTGNTEKDRRIRVLRERLLTYSTPSDSFGPICMDHFDVPAALRTRYPVRLFGTTVHPRYQEVLVISPIGFEGINLTDAVVELCLQPPTYTAFLRLGDGTLTLLPRSEHWHFPPEATTDETLLADVCAAHRVLHGTDADPDFPTRTRRLIESQPDSHIVQIPL